MWAREAWRRRGVPACHVHVGAEEAEAAVHTGVALHAFKAMGAILQRLCARVDAERLDWANRGSTPPVSGCPVCFQHVVCELPAKVEGVV